MLMNHPEYMGNILIFLLAALGVGLIFRKIKASPVLGYLVAGMLIGPHLTGWVDDITETHFLGQLGVMFLLFSIGLELPLQRLQSLKKYVFGVGTAQVVLSFIIFTLLGMCFGLSKEAAILIGSALSLSSTAVILQVLKERRELATRYGRISFSILLMQDLAVVVLLVLITTIGSDVNSLSIEVSFALSKAVLALIIIIFLGRIVFRPIYRTVASGGNAELFMATTFFVILGTSYLTQQAGLSMEVGAFLAGILLAETEYRHQIEADIQPFRGLLLGVFFMSIGISIDLHGMVDHTALILGTLAAMIFVKTIALFVICLCFGFSMSLAIRTSMVLAGGGEFVFIIFSPDIVQKFFTTDFINILFIVVALSMALTPFLAALAKWIADGLQMYEVKADIKDVTEELGTPKNHIIIAGYGQVGEMVGEILGSRLIPFIAIDNNMARVADGRAKGLPVFYGDARSLKVLKGISANQAQAFVVTLSQVTSSVKTVLMIKRNFPDLPICVRIRDQKHQDKLKSSGATLVVPETIEPSMQLTSTILNILGVPQEEVSTFLDHYRRKYLSLESKDA